MTNEISTLEKKQLISIENEIETAKQTVVDGFAVIGSRLKEIQESKLYKTAGFAGFEDYCQSRWQIKRAQAYRLISAVATIGKLSPIGDNLLMPAFEKHECTPDCFVKVENEAIARALGKIKDIEQLHEVWQAVNKSARLESRSVTARDVEGNFKALRNKKPPFRELRINPEFADILPALTEDEFSRLEASIVKFGVRHALDIWNGVLLDGHQRYAIAKKHNLPFKTVEREFANENEAKIFIINQQLLRKNLSPYEKAVVALDLEKIFAAKAEKRMISQAFDNATRLNRRQKLTV